MLGDHFENRPGAHFQTKMENRNPFSNYFETRVHFQTEFEKIPQARAWEARARARDPGPNGVFFQIQFKDGPFFQNSLKKDPFVQTFLKTTSRQISKNVTVPFFQSFTFW